MAYTFTDFAAIQNLRPFTIACFGSRPNNTGSADLIAKGSNNYLRDYSAITNNQFQYKRLTSNIDGTATSNPTWTTSDGIIHIVVTVSSAGVCKIYRNGTETTYTTTPTDINGSLTSDAGSDWVISLNSVTHAAIWGIALSASDVTALYNGGAGTNVYNVQSASILAAQDSAPTAAIGMRMYSNSAVQITNIVEAKPTVGVYETAKATGITTLSTLGVTTRTSGSTFLIFCPTSSFSSLSDSKGNSYTLKAQQAVGGQSGNLYECVNGVGGAGHTITVNYSSSGARSIYFLELLNCSSSDVVATASGSSPYTLTTNSLKTDIELALLFGVIQFNSTNPSTIAESTGFNIIMSNTDGVNYDPSLVAYKLVNSSTALSPSWTASPGTTTGATIVTTYKAVNKLYANGTFVCPQFIEQA